MICALQDCIAYDSSYEMKVQYDGMWDDESKTENELQFELYERIKDAGLLSPPSS
jgi:hypothetical protein